MDNLVKDSGRERPGALPEIVVIGVVVVFGVVLVIGAVVELGVVVVLVEGLNVLVDGRYYSKHRWRGKAKSGATAAIEMIQLGLRMAAIFGEVVRAGPNISDHR